MRSSGILMPVFSLWGDYGVGTLGKSAYDFIDFLSESSQKYWQILPLNPTSYGNSPYQSPCVFAGNPYLIDPDLLCGMGLLKGSDLDAYRYENIGKVDYSMLYHVRLPLIKKAASGIPDDDCDYIAFREKESFWLDNYCTFMALKEKNHMLPHSKWHDKSIKGLEKEINTHCKMQFLFYTQWLNLKNYANAKSVQIIGDLPIYPAEDSSDYFFSPDMFLQDVVAACPPDSFNINGQLWGNPIYDWQKLKNEGYSWWKKRLKQASELYDSVRIDHFRGFYEYYSTALGKSAKEGKWSKGPGLDFCHMVRDSFPSLDIIAEDLGFLTDDTREFFRQSGFDGMKVLLFAFDGNDSEYLPHNHTKNSVVYTGTHDTMTVSQWICQCTSQELGRAMDYLGANSVFTLCDCFVRGAFSSVSDRAIIPLQDWLKIGCSGRINTPGTAGKNWEWRIKEGNLTDNLKDKISSYTKIYKRYQED